MNIILNSVIILECVFFIYIHYKLNSGLLCIVQIQNYIWLIGFIIYLLNPLDYYDFQIDIYVYVFLYLFMFNLACVGSKTKNIKLSSINDSFITEVSNKHIVKKCIVASIISWVLSIPILTKSLPILFGSGDLATGMNLLRYQTYDVSITIFTNLEQCIMSYVIRPIGTVCIILLVAQIVMKKINYKLLIVTLVDTLLLILMTAGRALVVSLVIYMFASLIIMNGIHLFKMIYRYKYYIIPAVIVLFMIIFISSLRIARDNGVGTEFIIYQFSGIPYLSELLKHNALSDFTRLYGQALLSPIIDPFCLLFRLFNYKSTIATIVISNATNNMLYVAPKIKMNATSSILFSFLLDFGILGVIVDSFILGFVCRLVEAKFNKKQTLVNFGRYLFLFVCIVNSIQINSIANISTFSTWIFIFLLLTDSKIHIKNNLHMRRRVG